jgi:hypothetical protein
MADLRIVWMGGRPEMGSEASALPYLLRKSHLDSTMEDIYA